MRSRAFALRWSGDGETLPMARRLAELLHHQLAVIDPRNPIVAIAEDLSAGHPVDVPDARARCRIAFYGAERAAGNWTKLSILQAATIPGRMGSPEGRASISDISRACTDVARSGSRSNSSSKSARTAWYAAALISASVIILPLVRGRR